MSGLYIHIPFCKQACSYCDFYFVTRQEQKQEFVKELIREIESQKGSVFQEEPVRSIYFGGGTPSLLAADEVERILEAIKETFEVEPEEITLEMNPDDVSRDYLRDLKSAGINRASMGVQTFDAKLLDFMNRAHSSEEALKCLELLGASAIDVFTVDLIYGNPGQDRKMLGHDIDTILKFDPPHISAYSLTIEPRTRLGKQVKLGRLEPPPDEKVADHFDLVIERLAEAGIYQYEVSNYARPGKEALHNSAYWEHENYLGLGPGAHSFWWSENGKEAYRWSNKRDLKDYLGGGWRNRFDEEKLGMQALAEERLMLALRTKKGISENELKARYDFEFSPAGRAYLEESKHVILEDNNRIHLTQKGLQIADTIILDIITA